MDGVMDGEQNFRVDLHGLVDLLGRHLYSGPGVYVRELVLAGMDDQASADVRHSLVQRWVSMLDDAGRTEDAQRIWDELG